MIGYRGGNTTGNATVQKLYSKRSRPKSRKIQKVPKKEAEKSGGSGRVILRGRGKRRVKDWG